MPDFSVEWLKRHLLTMQLRMISTLTLELSNKHFVFIKKWCFWICSVALRSEQHKKLCTMLKQWSKSVTKRSLSQWLNRLKSSLLTCFKICYTYQTAQNSCLRKALHFRTTKRKRAEKRSQPFVGVQCRYIQLLFDSSEKVVRYTWLRRRVTYWSSVRRTF